MSEPKKVIIFLSGRGSNFKGLLDAERANPASPYKIIGVVSDKPGAPGLYYAKEAAIPVHSFFRSDFATFDEFKTAIFTAADSLGADYAALAGYMQIVPPWFVEKWTGRLINIHPSLLPKFPGLNTHARALEAKEKKHGCTVHFVDTGVDTGPIIASASVKIETGDSPESLAARVLTVEHKLYPWVLSQVARGAIRYEKGAVKYDAALKKEASSLGFLIPR